MKLTKPFIVAEIGGNHLGSKERAFKLIETAAECGANAVKFQCFDPDQMVGDPNYILTSGPWAGRNLLDLYKETYTPREWFIDLFAFAEDCGIIPFASVFHPDDIQFLEEIYCPMYKISSFEAQDENLILQALKTDKALIISTGSLDNEGLWRLWDLCRNHAIYLRCVSSYPATAAEYSLKTYNAFWHGQKIAWGLSDHTTGYGVAAAAITLGATVIEKHFTLENLGADAGFSINPQQLIQLVQTCQEAYNCTQFKPQTYGPDEQQPSATAKSLQRSLWWDADLPAGHIITENDLKSARPGDGIPPYHMRQLVGNILSKPVNKYSPVSWLDWKK